MHSAVVLASSFFQFVSTMGIFVIACSCLLVFLVTFVFKKHRKFPPGPPRLPIFGSLPFLHGKGVERYFSEKVVSYGPVTGLYIASDPMIVINDWKLAKTLFRKDEFSGRPR